MLAIVFVSFDNIANKCKGKPVNVLAEHFLLQDNNLRANLVMPALVLIE